MHNADRSRQESTDQEPTAVQSLLSRPDTSNSAQRSSSIGSRLRGYSLAAVSAAAVSSCSAVTADIVFLDLSGSPITSSGDIEVFVDILAFTQGANSIAVNFQTASYTFADPLSPNSEFMIRGRSDLTALLPKNGARFGYFNNYGYQYLQNVGTVGITTTMLDSSNNLAMYYDGFGGPFPLGNEGIAYFQFVNSGDGKTYEGWLHLVTGGIAGNLSASLVGITVNTSSIPEPSSGLALLCLGAAGIASYRRRKNS